MTLSKLSLSKGLQDHETPDVEIMSRHYRGSSYCYKYMKISHLKVILVLFLGLQWLVLVGYFRVAFNRSFLPLVWKHTRPYSGGTTLIPSTFIVDHSNTSRNILREIVGSGYEDFGYGAIYEARCGCVFSDTKNLLGNFAHC